VSSVVVPEPVPPPPTRSELVVDSLAVPGLDLVTAEDRVEAIARRVRQRRWAVAGALAAAVVVVGVLALVVGDRGDDLEATGDESTTTVATVPPSVPEPGEVVPVAPVTTASTVPVADGVAPPVPPESRAPLGATLSVSSSVTVGAPFTLAIDWSDADHAAAGEPSVTVEWNDPYLALTTEEPPPASCGDTGVPRAGRIERTFRYSSAGRRTISVRLRSCEGGGPLSEDTTVELGVDVRGVAGAPLVVAVDAAAGDPDAAGAVRYPASASGAQSLANRSTAVRQVLRRERARPATVLLASDWGAGDVVLLNLGGGGCRWGTLGEAGGADAAVLVESGCQPVLPTTTTTSLPPPSSTSPPTTAAEGDGSP